MDQILDNAIARCPFLANVASSQGSQFARSIALNPLVPASQTSGVRRPVLEELSDYSNTFRLWHGAGGVHPLPGIAAPAPLACPVARTPELQPEARPPATSTAPTAATRHGSRPLPLATMSLSFGDMPDFGQLFRALQQHANQPRRPQAQQKPRQPNNSRPAPAPSSSTANTSSGGQCPLRKVLGPLAPMVFNPKGHLVCPDVIIKARAALAATKPVRELRPQSLATKFLAVGATTALVNVPCGMAREHTEKFSFGWFVAVHASIPFIAMLRKAVIMPKYAIIYTIATAIAGQAMGAKLERKRMGRPKVVCSKGDGHMVAAAAAARPAAQLLSPSSRFSMDVGRPAVRTVRVSNAISKHTGTTARGHRTPSRGDSSGAPAPNASAIVPHMAIMAPGAMVAIHA